MQDLTRTSQALQAMVMQVRMIPVEAVFLRFPRLVRDLSTKLGKQVDLELSARTPSSTAPWSTRSATRSSTSSATRSTTASSRRRSASPPASRATGTLEISARHAGGNVVISVRDDGRGIDPARVARQGRRARA